jgi:Zn-dependent M28 family amino/carboxypeptidase
VSDQRARITRHLEALVGERHPDRSPEALTRTADYLAAEFVRSGWTTAFQDFQAWNKTYHNVLAVRQPVGRLSNKQLLPLLVGAHYDTVVGSPGADDNASGLVVLLEMAERLKVSELTRSVWLTAFCLEEQGYWGSQAFISGLKQSGEELAGALILECVGCASQEPGSQLLPPGVPVSMGTVGNFLGVIGNGASRSLVAAIEQAASRSVPSLKLLTLAVPGRGETLPDVRRSDHVPFWDAGYQAVMLTDTANFRNPHYHQPTDTIDRLNLDFLDQVIDTVIASVERLAGPDSE